MPYTLGMTSMAAKLFDQDPHPIAVNEKYHVFRRDNIANVYFWTLILEQLVQHRVTFDSVVECGVGRGRSLITLASLIQIYSAVNESNEVADASWSAVRIFGLDSFAGFPEPCELDASPRNPRRGEWSSSPSGKYKYTPDFLFEVLKNASVDVSTVTLLEGFFQDTAPRLALGRPLIGILHCDGDLYESYMDPLNNLADLVVSGGYIVFDDFSLEADGSLEPWPGARVAYEQFMQNHGGAFDNIDNLRGVAVLRRNSSPWRHS